MFDNKDSLLKLIEDQVEESGRLEYKAADALARSDGKKREITKDISSFANAAGGVIIYGIREFREDDRRHLPESLDPIDQGTYSKEWLDQMCGLIQPRIPGLEITPIHVGPDINHYCYVVTVPPGETAHQALDWRYYRRRNFEATPMEDYEVREVMNRKKHPDVTAMVRVKSNEGGSRPELLIKVTNHGRVIARNFAVVVGLPLTLPIGDIAPKDTDVTDEDGELSYRVTIVNVIGAPLFPMSSQTHRRELRRTNHQGSHDVTKSVSEVRCTVYADEMELRSHVLSVDELMSDFPANGSP